MATLYLKAAGGNFNGANWSATSAAGVDSLTPTAADNCIAELASGNLTTNAGSVCRSFDTTTGVSSWAGTFTNTAVLTIGDSTAGAGNVAFKLNSGVTTSGTGGITFVSTSATQQTVTTAGKTLGPLTYSGAAGSWQFQDNTVTSQIVQSAANTVDFNGKTYTISSSFNWTGAATKVATFGASIFNISGNGAALTGSGTITAAANTAQFNMTGGNLSVDLNNTNMNGASITTTPTIGGSVSLAAGTWANITINGQANKTDAFNVTGNLTATGTLTLNSNSTTNALVVQSNTVGTTRTITAATLVATNRVDFIDITGAGAATWTTAASGATAFGDGQGNSGITFTTPTTRYLITGGGSVNASSTGSWSTSSGGGTGASVPLPQDNVIMDSSSGVGTLTQDMPRFGKDITTTGYTGTWNNNSAATQIYGSMTWGSGMTFTAGNQIQFRGRGTHTITTAGITIGSFTAFLFNGFGGSYTLQDALTQSGSSDIQVLSGHFNTNGFTVTTLTFALGGSITRAVTLGTSTVNIYTTGNSVYWSAAATGLTLSAASSNIALTSTTAQTRIFSGASQIYGTLTYTIAGSTGKLNLGGTNYFDTINFSDVTNARTLEFAISVVNTIKNWNVNGTSGKLMSVVSATGGTTTFLKFVGPVSTNDYLSVKDIYSTIPYKFYAGVNSTDVSGNTNIVFTAKVTQPYITNYGELTAATTTPNPVFPLGYTAVAGDVLAVAISTASGSTISSVTGFTAVGSLIQDSTNAGINIYYKIAAGGETGASITMSSSNTSYHQLFAISGWTGTPTLDVVDSNTIGGGSATTLTTGSGVTNTAAPAYALAGWIKSSSLGNSVSFSNSFQEARTDTALANARAAGKPLTSTGSVSSTFTWTTAGTRGSSRLAIFKDVVAAGTAHNLSLLGVGS